MLNMMEDLDEEKKKAVAIINEGRGSHFDPDVVDAFLEIEETIKAVAKELADND